MKRFSQRCCLILGFPLIFSVFILAFGLLRLVQFADKIIGDFRQIISLFISAWKTL
jgi:hypothetical protein